MLLSGQSWHGSKDIDEQFSQKDINEQIQMAKRPNIPDGFVE